MNKFNSFLWRILAIFSGAFVIYLTPFAYYQAGGGINNDLVVSMIVAVEYVLIWEFIKQAFKN